MSADRPSSYRASRSLSKVGPAWSGIAVNVLGFNVFPACTGTVPPPAIGVGQLNVRSTLRHRHQPRLPTLEAADGWWAAAPDSLAAPPLVRASLRRLPPGTRRRHAEDDGSSAWDRHYLGGPPWVVVEYVDHGLAAGIGTAVRGGRGSASPSSSSSGTVRSVGRRSRRGPGLAAPDRQPVAARREPALATREDSPRASLVLRIRGACAKRRAGVRGLL